MMNLNEIIEITGAKLLLGSGDSEIENLVTDSRKVTSTEHALFIAIVGERHDGHDFINALVKKGVRHFLVSQKPNGIPKDEHCDFLLVYDTMVALQKIAIAHRNKYDLPVIGITGSNGKTVVKEWLSQILNRDKKVVKSPKSYNSQLGVPLSVWQINSDHELGIFEAGISTSSEMDQLKDIIQPTLGVITNIREAHIENFKSKQEIANEKVKLFEKCEKLIYCSDYHQIDLALDANDGLSNVKRIKWSYTGEGKYQIESLDRNSGSVSIICRTSEREHHITIPFNDQASIENAIHCWILLLEMGYSDEWIQSGMRGVKAVAMRLEVREGIMDSTIINDGYNNDLASIHIALDFLNQHKTGKRSVVILSDVEQSGKDEISLNRSIAELIKNKGVDEFIGIGPSIGDKRDFFPENSRFFKNTGSFLEQLHDIDWRNSAILLKGARQFEFEKIADRLQIKAHETVLEVNLTAAVHNFNYFKSLLKKDTKIMAMVKASSYGAGNYEIANMLEYNKVDYLGVAYADEGIEIKEKGISVPVMVMNPQTSAFDAMVRHGIEPEIYNFRTLKLFVKELKDNKYFLTTDEPFSIQLKIDTGMHRLGFGSEDIKSLIAELYENQEWIKVKTVFTHLAAADDKDLDNVTVSQIKEFQRIHKDLEASLGYKIMRHVLNSSGIIRFNDCQFEMVRLGIGMYGFSSLPEHESRLLPVMRLKSVVSQIRKVPAGDSIGYGGHNQVAEEKIVATIPIGYADGIGRGFGNGKLKVRIGNESYPTIGNICMDMCMIDVTGGDVNEGEEVVIFDNQNDVRKMAEELSTIPYEILTGISSRVKRLYYEE